MYLFIYFFKCCQLKCIYDEHRFLLVGQLAKLVADKHFFTPSLFFLKILFCLFVSFSGQTGSGKTFTMLGEDTLSLFKYLIPNIT